ncbi:uncharacterized protein KZ484_007677 [Pholidichthys leucotaenia]
MNRAVQCIILLACVAVCMSARRSAVIKQCLCVKASKFVQPSLIADATEYEPRPYCNKKEIIVKKKDNTLECLDPETRFAKKVMETINIKKAERMKTISLKTTTPSSRTTTLTTGSITTTGV